MALLEGKVAIVTGAGRGIGREEALLMARHGAKVVVNVESVTDFKAAKRIFECAIDNFGKLNILVNNAGILRDRMIFNMSEEDWDAVIAVHLKGSFNLSRHACAYWREQHKLGNLLNGRIIMTSSDSGLLGNAGQSNYGAAKAALAAMAIIIDREMARYGVTANAIAPVARTRMTVEGVPSSMFSGTEGKGFDPYSPANVAPVVAWLASDDAKDVHGEVFRSGLGGVWVLKGWSTVAMVAQKAVWDPVELGKRLKEELARGITQKETLGGVIKSVLS